MMVLDTSVWVAALLSRHPRHQVAVDCLAGVSEPAVAGHLLAELFAVLTRIPTKPRIVPSMARRLIAENVTARCHVVDLGQRDYEEVLARLVDWDVSGGAIYDALHVQAALKVKATQLHTFNGADFRRVWPDAGDRLVVLA